MNTTAPNPAAEHPCSSSTPPFSNCTHCGFCLAACPTYKLTGDENNSPRGRVRLWGEEAAGRLEPDPMTDFYTAECVGCLACETACPAHVPFGELLEQARHQQVQEGRFKPKWPLRIAAHLVKNQAALNLALLPARLLRTLGGSLHRFLFKGNPPVLQRTADYARQLMAQHRPTGPRVALLTGCVMEALFREINFATLRVLVENNVQVVVPETQGCCGAFHEHMGFDGVQELRQRNRSAFSLEEVDAVVANSSGCGYALGKALAGGHPVLDVLTFLGSLETLKKRPSQPGARLYVDLPCHLVHGQKTEGIPANVLDATGLPWELAPAARDCCGSGGAYNIQNPGNATAILRKKSAFLNSAEGAPVILGTSNHVCMMQWNSARSMGLVERPYEVRHILQLLDPERQFTGSTQTPS